MEEKTIPGGISALTLHLIAMGFMLCDHLWASVIPGNAWLTWVGRLAFPIFAFLIAEGYHHTASYKKYRSRLLTAAVLSELPFNLLSSGLWFYPFHQNVLWTFLLALICLKTLDALREKFRPLTALPLMALTAAGFYLLGTLAMVDYFGFGILTVLVFSLFRGRSWWCLLGQAAGLYVINWELMGGLTLPVTLLGATFEIPQQGMAIFALIPIWCYRGRQGPKSTFLRYFCYGFYPVHMLILGLLSR